MLVLSRKVGERILVGDQIRITVVRLTHGGVRLGIEAPDGTTVIREELMQKRLDLEPPASEGDGLPSETQGASSEPTELEQEPMGGGPRR